MGIGEQLKGMLSNSSSSEVKDYDAADEEVKDEKGESSDEDKTGAEEDEALSEDEGEKGGEDEAEASKGEEDEDKGEEGEQQDEEDLSEIDILKKQNELLQQRLDAVTAPEEKEEEEEASKFELAASEFFTSEDNFQSFADSREGANKVLNAVVGKAATAAIEHVYKRVPATVARIVEAEVANYRLADDFFTENRDLLPFRKIVALVFDKMVEDSPDKKPGDIFGGLAKEARKYIKKAGSKKKDKQGKRRNPFLSAGGDGAARGRAPEKPEGLKKEFGELEGLK